MIQIASEKPKVLTTQGIVAARLIEEAATEDSKLSKVMMVQGDRRSKRTSARFGITTPT